MPIIVVNATLNGKKFQSQLQKIENSLHGEILMISDECHHHANRNIIKKLPKAKYIMGLSATPWNPGDKESESILKSYYVDEVYTYSLQQALDDDRLCQYNYNIHEVELNAEEEEEYLRLTKIIPDVGAFKLGLEYFCSNGPEGIKLISDTGVKIFLDLLYNFSFLK